LEKIGERYIRFREFNDQYLVPLFFNNVTICLKYCRALDIKGMDQEYENSLPMSYIPRKMCGAIKGTPALFYWRSVKD
jgi:hypothetical protein